MVTIVLQRVKACCTMIVDQPAEFVDIDRCLPAAIVTRATTTRTSGTVTGATRGTVGIATRGTGERGGCPERGSSTWPTVTCTMESECGTARSVMLFVSHHVAGAIKLVLRRVFLLPSGFKYCCKPSRTITWGKHQCRHHRRPQTICLLWADVVMVLV